MPTGLLPLVVSVLGCYGGGPPAAPDDAERLVERTVVASVHVDDVVASLREVRAAVTDHDGWIVSSRASDERGASLAARVPVERLDDFRAAVGAIGEVVEEEERAEDVTSEVVDREARLRNARVEEERLLAIYERAASVQDVMAVATQLAVTRERIEQLVAEAEAQRTRVEHALVTIDLARTPVPFWEAPGEAIESAASAGIDLAAGLVVGSAAAIVALGPSAAIVLACVLLLVAAARALSRRRRAVAAS